MTSKRSTLNSTFTPLGKGNSFLGQFEQVTQYATALLTIECDQIATLIVYTSSDLKTISTTEYTIPASTLTVKYINLTQPYFKVVLSNNTSSDMTVTNLETIYREVSVANPMIEVNLLTRQSALLWNSAMINSDSVSSSIDLTGGAYSNQSFYGSISDGVVLAVQFSPDNVNWFTSSSVYNQGGGGTFGFSLQSSAKYLRLYAVSAPDVTITAYCDAT